MDHTKLIGVIKEFPQVWDRSCVTFREQNLKNEAWQRIGEIMSTTANSCKDNFKSLREKYVREREKQTMYGEKYMPWQYLESLSFLDPHIILRKQSLNYENEIPAVKPEPVKRLAITDDPIFAQMAENYSDFDKSLIALVRKSSPIWDRKSNGYPSKQVKYQLWRSIAHAMNKDVNICMTRWKGLREKYIRQRNKYYEGDGKWEFLDDMTFLDKVIQYRKKNCEPDITVYTSPSDENFSFHNSFDDNSIHDSSSNDISPIVKTEEFNCDIQDSSFDSGTGSSERKRSTSYNSEEVPEKREKITETYSRTPEEMFGELVAVMLAKKAERDKNIAMIEIMKVLTN